MIGNKYNNVSFLRNIFVVIVIVITCHQGGGLIL